MSNNVVFASLLFVMCTLAYVSAGNDGPGPAILCSQFEELKETNGCDSCYYTLNPGAACAQAPVTRCVCIDGYARNDTGTCIPKAKCAGHSTQCPRFEERKVSIGCDSCSDILSRNSSPPSVCAHAPYMKCACIDGFARHTNGTCIPKGDCTEQKPFKDGKGGE